jgi:predicted DNA-binding helix-hairpin-helix protein
MDPVQRLQLQNEYLDLELDGESCRQLPASRLRHTVISHAVLPGGQRMPLVKGMITSACERDCFYCPFRAGRDFRRATFQPDELARTYLALFKAGITQGLFLSSGIMQGGQSTQDKLLATAAILREKYLYKGYLHLKIMPGADYAQLERACQLADRISINLEAPNQNRLTQLAPKKKFTELEEPLRWYRSIQKSLPNNSTLKLPSATTQFVVGSAGEPDKELLISTAFVYQQYHLQRVYFSSFRPVPGTPFANIAPCPPERQLRLYQASFLLRDYDFSVNEFVYLQDGNLSPHGDPKWLWAEKHLRSNPVELNSADHQTLMRVPGIGKLGAKRIVKSRQQHNFRNIDELAVFGLNVRRIAPFVLVKGRRPAQQARFSMLLPEKKPYVPSTKI